MKQKFYSLERINKLDCEYNLILGERSNGKSFAVKHKCIKDALEDDNKKFIYLRRWDLEIKPSLVMQYFTDVDIYAISDSKFNKIEIKSGVISVIFRDEDNKITNRKVIGYSRALSMEEHYTSGIYTDVINIIYEEFIARQSYLPRESQKLQQFVSTIARRHKIRVWLVGNTISRMCPYFSEWELKNIPKQKQGTIDIYEHKTDQQNDEGEFITIKIAVEYAENSGNNSKMFFGSSAKMINSGMWQSEEKPHLPKKIDDYYIMYEMIIEWKNFKFLCQFLNDKKNGNIMWFISPKTTPIQKNTRVISDNIYDSFLATNGLYPICDEEILPFNLLKQKKVFYSDNLTGSDFETALYQILLKG